ncbi:MAG TPA: hypothetical protein VK642_04755 [Burkholderiales bacterium]|nr:hypothetical protein [Burkholderiales bacterium]
MTTATTPASEGAALTQAIEACYKAVAGKTSNNSKCCCPIN